MSQTAPEDFSPPFEIIEPTTWRAPIIFNSPHSGSIYPDEFLALSRLSLDQLRQSEDFMVDRLVMGLAASGFGTIRAHFPRCYVDVNREPYELDPRMFEGRLPSFANTHSMRVAGGLGTIARVAGDAQEIYRTRLPVAEALRRVETLYKPYHRALRRLISKVHRQFGMAILVDCHSMPSTSAGQDGARRPDFVLGDRYGNSCTSILISEIERLVHAQGYTSVRNKPYAGGFITEHYGNPLAGLHAIQIEMNRAIYMDERSRTPSHRFADVAALMATMAERLAQLPPQHFMPYPAAAE